MKEKIAHRLPQIVIVLVIVAVGVSIVLGQLKSRSPKTAGQSVAARSTAQPAQPSGGPGGMPGATGAGPVEGASPAAGGLMPASGAPLGTGAQRITRAAGASGASGASGAAAASTGARPTAAGASGAASSGAAAATQSALGASGSRGAVATTTRARTVSVRAAAIKKASLNTYTKIHGDVVSATEVKVYASVAGKLLERRVALGERVLQGTVLATVDPSKVGQTYLPNPVESPLAGTVLSIPVNPGDTIGTTTVIATVGDLSKLRISTAVSERYVGNLKIGTSAQVSFDAIPDLIFNAKISELSPVIDPSSRTRDVKLSLLKSDPRILPGMFATIKLVIESRDNVLVVPRSAVTLSSQGAYVFVVNEKSDGTYTATRKDIELGLEGEEFFELASGLAEGESVVTEGRSVVTDGDNLRLVGGLDGASL